MFCPHCGAENDAGNRYCVGCGSELPRAAEKRREPRSLRERFRALLGTSRRARLTTAATAVALVVAAAALFALEPSEEDPATGPFTSTLDRVCVDRKRTIAALERETVRQQSPDLATFAGALVSIVEEWRLDLAASPPPPAHAPAAHALDSALLDVLIEAGALGRASREGKPAEVVARARAVDLGSARIDQVAEELGLTRCADLPVAPVGTGPA